MNGMVPASAIESAWRVRTRSAPGSRRTGSRRRSARSAAVTSTRARRVRTAIVGVRFGALHGDPGIQPRWRQWMSSARGLGADPGRRAPALRRQARDRLIYGSNPIGYRVDWMHQQLAWYVGGPVLGLCVVALRWLLNERLGATGAWSDAVERVSGRARRRLRHARLVPDRPDRRRRRLRDLRRRPRRLRLAHRHVHRRSRAG